MCVFRLQLFLALLLFITTSLGASSATSFCKCTCKGNSTIIALNPRTTISSATFTSPHTSPHHPSLERDVEILQVRKADERGKTHRVNTCNDCNRKFCLDYNLPGCRGVKEEEVFTTCFQRDSLKDEAVVFIFITATVALLLWALVKPYVQRLYAMAQERRTYIPLSGQEASRSDSA